MVITNASNLLMSYIINSILTYGHKVAYCNAKNVSLLCISTLFYEQDNEEKDFLITYISIRPGMITASPKSTTFPPDVHPFWLSVSITEAIFPSFTSTENQKTTNRRYSCLKINMQIETSTPKQRLKLSSASYVSINTIIFYFYLLLFCLLRRVSVAVPRIRILKIGFK